MTYLTKTFVDVMPPAMQKPPQIKYTHSELSRLMMIDAKIIAKKQGGKVGGTPKTESNEAKKKRIYHMTGYTRRLMDNIKENPHKPASFFVTLMGSTRESIRRHLHVIKQEGYPITKTVGQIPLYFLDDVK